MRTIYDSTNAADIPANAEMVGGYDDGLYKWKTSDWARFPKAAQVHIVVRASTNAGDVLDVEKGDATPDQAPGWVKMRRAAGVARPTVYCPLSEAPAVIAACRGLTYDLWTAHYTGTPHICTKASDGKTDLGHPVVATQYADPPGSGGHYDLSLVADDGWPHRTEGDISMADAESIEQHLSQVNDFLAQKMAEMFNNLQARDDANQKRFDEIEKQLQSGSGGSAPTKFKITGTAEAG